MCNAENLCHHLPSQSVKTKKNESKNKNQINLNPNSTQTCNSIIILSTYATHLHKDGALNIIIFSVYRGYYTVCEDMNFIFERENNILRTSAASE